MFKVSRKSEYALLAVQVLSRNAPEALVSVADLAAAEAIPPDILAKVLQSLKRAGVVEAAKGSGGGYRLARPLGQIRFLDVIRPFEEQVAVVTCQDGGQLTCDRQQDCQLREPMAVLNAFVMRQVDTLSMELFLAPARLHDAAPLAATETRSPLSAHTAEGRSLLDVGLARHAKPAAARVQP